MWTIAARLSTIVAVSLVAPLVGSVGCAGTACPLRHRQAAGRFGPMTISTSTSNDRSRLADYLSGAGRRVDEALRRYLPEESDDPAAACPARLAAAMRYSVLGGGKRLRPVLCLMAAEACGGRRRGGAAGGLRPGDGAHLFADPRRPAGDGRRRPAAGPADLPQGVRRGDGDPGRRRRCLTLAFEVIARAHPARPRRRSAACGSWPRRRARRGWSAGQMADLQAEGRDRRPRSTALEAIHRRKTGALLRAPLAHGGARRRAPTPRACAALDVYGRRSGLAFQIVDDLLDVQGDEAKLGKRVGKDSELGKWTYPGFLGVDGSRQPRPATGRRGRRGAGAARAARRSACRPWRWIFWKGIVDEQHDVARGSSRRPT